MAAGAAANVSNALRAASIAGLCPTARAGLRLPTICLFVCSFAYVRADGTSASAKQVSRAIHGMYEGGDADGDVYDQAAICRTLCVDATPLRLCRDCVAHIYATPAPMAAPRRVEIRPRLCAEGVLFLLLCLFAPVARAAQPNCAVSRAVLCCAAIGHRLPQVGVRRRRGDADGNSQQATPPTHTHPTHTHTPAPEKPT